MEKIDKLTQLLLKLQNISKNPDSVNFGEGERGFLALATCRDIALAQQNVLSAGVGAAELWKMWSRNNRILPDQAAKLRVELAPNHILQKVLAEHDMVLCFISDLEDTNRSISGLNLASSANTEIRKLAHISEHLCASEQHREREEYVIYPELERRGYTKLLKIIYEQHHQINEQISKLKKLIWQVDVKDFDAFKYELKDIVDYLVVAMRIHIFMETNIIFPLAIEVINSDAVWTRIKNLCEEIGYCGYDVRWRN
ncbi:MAG: hemerythrin domain-containing protein [Phycisphaerae bacterium]|nr:hemerythrin domain-containing protein [Phycisphaerae bacterium]